LLTYPQIEKRLWDTANQVLVRTHKPSERRGWARVDFEGSIRVIHLPLEKHDGYQLRSFLHELLHITLGVALNVWHPNIHEAFLEFELEPGLIQYVHSNARRHRRWLLHMNKLIRHEGGLDLLMKAKNAL
jgi:hypothetical protein